GGRLVYCTCSLEPEEGEDQIARLIAGGLPVERLAIGPAEVGAPPEAATPAGDLRTLPCQWPDPDPGQGGLDGFFISRLTVGAATQPCLRSSSAADRNGRWSARSR